jgi:predicted RNase H-like HicB family nuclease
MKDTNYRVVVTRDEAGWWAASVVGIDGAHTEARTLAALDHEVREVIALVLDLPDGAESLLDLIWDIHTDDDEVDRQAADLRAERMKLFEAERELTSRTAMLAHRLRQRYSVRDVATMLGLSPQRVSQIAPEGRSRTAA